MQTTPYPRSLLLVSFGSENFMYDCSIASVIEWKVARDFIRSKGLWDEYVKYCDGFSEEVAKYLEELAERIRQGPSAEKKADQDEPS